MNTGWWEIDIHDCYSLEKIAFAPICACKKTIDEYDVTVLVPRSRDVTDQLWWRHNIKSEKIVIGDNGEMRDRWLFLVELCVQDIKERTQLKFLKKIHRGLPVNTDSSCTWRNGEIPSSPQEDSLLKLWARIHLLPSTNILYKIYTDFFSATWQLQGHDAWPGRVKSIFSKYGTDDSEILPMRNIITFCRSSTKFATTDMRKIG